MPPWVPVTKPLSPAALPVTTSATFADAGQVGVGPDLDVVGVLGADAGLDVVAHQAMQLSPISMS